jgi:hypothetical protein
MRKDDLAGDAGFKLAAIRSGTAKRLSGCLPGPGSLSAAEAAAGGEVDLVLEGDFGLIPIEIKHNQTVRSHELQALGNFIADFKCPFGLVINNDERPRFYTERILGVPFAFV